MMPERETIRQSWKQFLLPRSLLCLVLTLVLCLAWAAPDASSDILGEPSLHNAQNLAQNDQQNDQGVPQEKASDKASDKASEGEGGGARFLQAVQNFSLSASLRSARQSLYRALWLWRTPSDTVSGDYLALGYAELERAFPRASSIAVRLADRLPTREVWERAFLAHVHAGEMEKALVVADKLQGQKDGHGFLARFLLASDALKHGEAERAREIVGDLSGFGTFARYGAATYRFWLSFAEDDTRGEQAALQELERESREDFARLLRVYASFARGEFRITQQLLREAESLSDDLSLQWVQALHHARSEQERGKQTALALLEPVKVQLNVQVLFLDEMARRIESDEYEKLLPNVGREKWDDWAAFFLARSLADLAVREGNPEAKLLFARLAVETEPSSSYARVVLSDALSDYGQDEEALDIVEKIPPDALFYRQSLYSRAEILRRQDRLDEAFAVLKNLQEVRPDDPLAWWYTGSFQRVAEEPIKALPYLDQAISLYLAREERLPNEVRASAWRLYYERGIAYERAEGWDNAERDFISALQLSPEQPMVMNYLAYTWLDLQKDERYQEALSMLQRAAQLRESSGAVIDSLGWAYYRLKEYGDALETLERAVALAPDDTTINDHLGDVYWRVGRLLEARYQWSRVLAFETENKELRTRAQKKLEDGLPADIE